MHGRSDVCVRWMLLEPMLATSGPLPGDEERFALVLGLRGNGPVRYAGRVEWGLTRDHFEELVTRCRPVPDSPLAGWAPEGAVFFEAGILAEVRYLAGSRLRHATLRSLAFSRRARMSAWPAEPTP